MAEYLSKEQKSAIVAEYGGDAKNTGSVEAQIALFTHKINGLSNHLKTNRKDQSCKVALLSLVGQRKRYLSYLSRKDINKYRALIEKLGIRK